MYKKVLLTILILAFGFIVWNKFLTHDTSHASYSSVPALVEVDLDIQPTDEVPLDSSSKLKRQLISHLKKQRFTDLNQLIEAQAELFDKGELSEPTLDNLLEGLALIDPDLEEPILNWVKETKSWSANLVAARYFNQISWQWRGGAFWSKVPDLNKKKFRRYQGLATTFMQDAKQNNDRDVLWYSDQINLANQGSSEDELSLIKEGLAKYPQSVLIHHAAIHAQQSHWGGDEFYRQQLIHDYSEVLDKASHDGGPTIYFYRAIDAAKEKAYVKAISAIREALSQSPNRLWYYAYLAKYYYKTEQYPLALAAINTTLAHRPDRHDDLLLRANVYMEVDQPERALPDLEAILKASPMHKEANLKMFSASAKLKKRELALASLERAVFFTQESPDELVRQGFAARYDLGDSAIAKRYFYKAIELNEFESGAHYNLSTLYGNEESCEIVEHIYKYLVSCKTGVDTDHHWCQSSYVAWGFSAVNHLKDHRKCPEISDYDFTNLR